MWATDLVYYPKSYYYFCPHFKNVDLKNFIDFISLHIFYIFT